MVTRLLAILLLTGCTEQLKSDYRYADCCLPDSGADAGCEWRAVAYRTWRGLEPLASEGRVCADTGLETYR